MTYQNYNQNPFPSINKVFTRSLGSLAILQPLIKELKVRETIDKRFPKERKTGPSHGQIAEVLVLNRLASPQPMYRVAEWANQVALQEITGIKPEGLDDDRILRTLEILSPEIEKIEAEIALLAITRFNLDTNIVHHDLTSFYFEGDYENEESITFGYSRDEKFSCKQINLGLNCGAKEGVPYLHQTYPGNTPDVTTVKENMEKLKKVLKRDDFIIVSDRGQMSYENIKACLRTNLSFVGALSLTEPIKEQIRNLSEKDFKDLTKIQKSLYLSQEMEVTVRGKDKDRGKGKNGTLKCRGLVIKSLSKLKQDRKRRKTKIAKAEEKLKHISSNLNHYKYKRKKFVQEQIFKAFLRSPVKKYFKINLQGKDGALKLNWSLDKELIERDEALDGKYLIITSLPEKELSSLDLFLTYKSREKIESRIRNVKTDLKIRPVFLKKENRIQSLVLITILALIVYSLLEILSERKGLKMTSRRIFQIFEGLDIVHLNLAGQEFLLATDLSPPQEEILRQLSLPRPAEFLGQRA